VLHLGRVDAHGAVSRVMAAGPGAWVSGTLCISPWIEAIMVWCIGSAIMIPTAHQSTLR
jgi:hypothetical protein